MFGRRRRRTGRHSHANDAEWTSGSAAESFFDDAEGAGTGDTAGASAVPTDRPHGPWDETEPAPDLTRVDLGAVRVPVAQEFDVQLNVLHEEVVAATITHEASSLQLQAFAAPKSGGLWDEAREEIARELASGSGEPSEVEGPFGSELRAELAVQTENGAVPQPARFVGVDGPRWLLRGVFTGPAGSGSDQAQLLEDVFRGTVVVRGEQPMPPRERLPLRVPEDAVEHLSEEEPPASGAASAGS